MWHVARARIMKTSYKIFIIKSEGKRPLGRQRKLEDNIKIAITEMKFECVDCIHVNQDWESWRVLVNMVMSLRL